MNSLEIVRKFCPKVQEVRDATRDITIEVTPKDVSASRKREHVECAIATACRRAQDLDGVIIARTTAYLVKGVVATRYHMPVSTRTEAAVFDRGGGFTPGEYRLVKPFHQMGEPSRRNGKNGSLVAQHGTPKHFTHGIRTSLTRKDA